MPRVRAHDFGDEMQIRPLDASENGAVVDLALRAWEPVFESLRGALGSEIYRELVPDWRESQRDAVEAVCSDDETRVFTAVERSRVVGFTALRLRDEDGMGEIYMIAVDPEFQRRGIATALTEHALDWFRDAGVSLVMVETGGDPGHAPARRTYESAGFQLLPIARYFKKLDESDG